MDRKSISAKHFLATQELMTMLKEKVEAGLIEDKEVAKAVEVVINLEKELIIELKRGIK